MEEIAVLDKFKENVLTIGWSIKMALRINAKVFLLWGMLSVLLASLPAVALYLNRQTIFMLSAFLENNSGSFREILPTIVMFGIILTAIGLSRRINGDFLYFIMYDSYYFGLEEHMMEVVKKIEIKTLMDKKYRDEHWSVMGRCGALADFMSAGCLFLSKLVGAVSLLIVSAQASVVVFWFATTYIVAVLGLNYFTADRLRWDGRPRAEAERLSNYYQSSALSPGFAKEIRVYDLGKETIEKWETAYKKVERIDERYAKLRQMAAFVSSVGFYVFMSGILTYCIFRVANRDMTIDIFLMLYYLGQNISELAIILSSSFQETNRGLYFLNMQRKFVNSVPKTKRNWEEGFVPDDNETVFKMDSVCFSYDNDHEVLHDLSFSIKKGETIALVGMNGSGKTTLIKLMIGIFSPTKGSISFYGKPYNNHTQGAIMQRVGMFFQDFHIFHASLRENVGFGDIKRISDKECILFAMHKGGAEKLLNHLPKGLEHWLLRNVIKDGAMLSGGEKQRVAASRAYMSNKEVLIFDEPAAALDPIAEMEQFQAIKEKISGNTAVLISHRVGFARLADRIIVLDNGRLAETGTHEELMDKNGIYACFFREQAQWYDTKVGDINE